MNNEDKWVLGGLLAFLALVFSFCIWGIVKGAQVELACIEKGYTKSVTLITGEGYCIVKLEAAQ